MKSQVSFSFKQFKDIEVIGPASHVLKMVNSSLREKDWEYSGGRDVAHGKFLLEKRYLQSSLRDHVLKKVIGQSQRKGTMHDCSCTDLLSLANAYFILLTHKLC